MHGVEGFLCFPYDMWQIFHLFHWKIINYSSWLLLCPIALSMTTKHYFVLSMCGNHVEWKMLQNFIPVALLWISFCVSTFSTIMLWPLTSYEFYHLFWPLTNYEITICFDLWPIMKLPYVLTFDQLWILPLFWPLTNYEMTKCFDLWPIMNFTICFDLWPIMKLPYVLTFDQLWIYYLFWPLTNYEITICFDLWPIMNLPLFWPLTNYEITKCFDLWPIMNLLFVLTYDQLWNYHMFWPLTNYEFTIVLTFDPQDNQLTLQNMLVSPHLADLRPEAELWASTLRQVEDMLDLWVVCQKKVLWMDGWMDWWMDWWMDRWMDRWIDWMDRWMDEWIDRWMDWLMD